MWDVDAKSGWHSVKTAGGDYFDDAGSALSMPAASSYVSTPAAPPVTWDLALTWGDPSFTTGGTDLSARSWVFTVTNGIGQIANMSGGSTKYSITQKGGFYAEDLDMELSITIPSEDSAWIKKRIQTTGLIDVTTTIDTVRVRWGNCRLAIDQSPMTSTAGYDETLTFKVGYFKFQTTSGLMGMAAPSPDGGDAGTGLDVDTGLPSGDEEQRRGRWPRWSPTTTPTWTPATRSPTRAPTP